MPGLSAAAAGGIVERDYTGWGYKWSWAPPDGVRYGDSTNISLYIEEVNDIFYLWWYDNKTHPEVRKIRFGAFNIRDHSTIFASSRDSDYTYDNAIVAGYGDYTISLGCHSFPYLISRSHQTYLLLQRADLYTIEVWRAGSLLWSRDVRTDTGANSYPKTGEISLTGKYILFYDETTEKLLLYEGT